MAGTGNSHVSIPLCASCGPPPWLPPSRFRPGRCGYDDVGGEGPPPRKSDDGTPKALVPRWKTAEALRRRARRDRSGPGAAGAEKCEGTPELEGSAHVVEVPSGAAQTGSHRCPQTLSTYHMFGWSVRT